MRFLERVLFGLGLLLLAFAAAASAWSEHGRLQGLAAFAMAQQASAARSDQPGGGPTPRVAPFGRAATSIASGPPAADAAIAILRVPRIAMEVPVRLGTTRATLGRGAGLVEGSAAPGSDGNIAIAAHRDGFFRGLREVVVGDRIELRSRDATRVYRITELRVVMPDDVSVLAEVGAPAITLITCFPFHFVGPAPQRFVVRGVADAVRG